MSLSPPVVVCSACRRGIRMIVGARHWDVLMRQQASAIPKEDHPFSSEWEQGFIDQHCNFLTRTEAWKIAEANGQIIRRVGGDEADGGTLFSENLY